MIRLLLVCALGPLSAWAHDPGLSSATVDLTSRDMLVQIVFAPADLTGLRAASLAVIAPQTVEMTTANATLSPISVETRELGPDNVEYTLRFPRPMGEEVIFRAPLLSRLPFGHRQSLTIRDEAGTTTATELLSTDQDRVQLPIKAGRKISASMRVSPLLVAGALAVIAIGWLAGQRRALTAAV